MTYIWFNLDRFVHLVAMAFTACRLLLLRSTVVRTIAGAKRETEDNCRNFRAAWTGNTALNDFKRFSHMISDVTELLLVGVHRIMLPPRTAVYVSNNFLQDSSRGFENKIEKHRTNLFCSHGEAVFAHEA